MIDGNPRKKGAKEALTFAPVSFFAPGALARIIKKSYAALVEECPDYWEAENENWEDFDREAFAHPETVGECAFISLLEGAPVGLASYDPRQAPRYGIVGQNCVLPEFRGRGVGKRQIAEILRRFRQRGMRTALVTTSAHPFFLPARKMYESLGFDEIRRFAGGPDPRYDLIELEKNLVG
jgi:GNAT superfamily N-acetyltransferase